jgi:hypothetical protein
VPETQNVMMLKHLQTPPKQMADNSEFYSLSNYSFPFFEEMLLTRRRKEKRVWWICISSHKQEVHFKTSVFIIYRGTKILMMQ